MAKSRIAEAYVQVVPRIDGIASSLQSQLGPQVDAAGVNSGAMLAKGMSGSFAGKIKGYLAPIAASMATTFAAVGVANYLKDSVNLASDFAEQGAAVGQVFGKSSDAIQKFAAGGATALGQSKTQILDAAKSFGIYGKAAGLAGDKNVGFSTDLVKLATDLASFNNTSVDEAIQALQSGLRGESEPLRKYGVLLNDADMRNQALRMGLIKTTKEALTPQQKVLAANALIFKQTSTQQGDFARTSDGLANQQRILAANFENTKIALGTNLLPVMNNLVKYANASIIPAINGIGDGIKWMQENANISVPILAGLGGVIVAALAPAIWGAVTATWAWTAALLANPFTWIVLGIGLLIGGIVALAMNWDKVTKWISTVWSGFMGWIGDTFKNIGKWWNDLWGNVGKWFSDQWAKVSKAIGDGLSAVGKWFAELPSNLLKLLVNGAVALWNWFAAVGGWILSNVVKGIVVVWNFFTKLPLTIANLIIANAPAIWAFFTGMPARIIGLLGNAGSWLMQTGKNIVQGLLDGIGSLAGTVGKFFLDKLPSWIVAPFKAALGIHSPSKVFKEFGKNILDGLREGLVGDKANVKDTMKKVTDWLKDAFDSKKISARARSAGIALTNAFSAQLQKLEKQHADIVKRMEDAETKLADKIKERLDFITKVQEQYGGTLNLDVKTVDPKEVAKAQAALTKAQADYNKTLADTKSTSEEIADALTKVQDAQAALADAQSFGTTATGAIADLKAKIAKTAELQKVTDQLQQMGLNKDLYKQIVEAGAVDFAKSIIEGGQAAVDQLNILNDQANAKALELATKVGDVLYAEGIKFAQATYDGLKAEEANMNDLMSRVAAAYEIAIGKIVAGAKAEIDAAISSAKSIAAQAVAHAQAAANAAKSAGTGTGTSTKTGTTAPKVTVTSKATTAIVKAVSSAASVAARAAVGKGVTKFAAGGFVNGPTRALIGEAGPEVVTPLKDFERMMGLNNPQPAQTVNYYAAPNNSLDSERELQMAMKRAKVVSTW